MLVLRRSEGQWVEIVHQASGDVLRIRTYDLTGPTDENSGRLQVAFDDPDHNFAIHRPERKVKGPPAPQFKDA